MLGVVPSDQRLEPGDRLARGIDRGLVDELQLLFLERDPKVGFHQLPLARGLVHLGSEEAEASLARSLGGIERKVGVAHQIVRSAIVIVRCDNPDRRSDRHRRSVDRVRPRQAVDYALGDARQLVLGRGRRKHHLEFVAAEAADLAEIADDVAQP